MKNKIKEIIKEWWPLLILAFLTAVMLVGCKGADKIVYVPIHDTMREQVYNYSHDTTIIEKTREVVVHGDCTETHDTIRELRVREVHDTNNIYQYIEKPIEVVKTKTEIKKVYMWWPSALILIVFGDVGYLIYRRLKMPKK